MIEEAIKFFILGAVLGGLTGALAAISDVINIDISLIVISFIVILMLISVGLVETVAVILLFILYTVFALAAITLPLVLVGGLIFTLLNVLFKKIKGGDDEYDI